MAADLVYNDFEANNHGSAKKQLLYSCIPAEPNTLRKCLK